MAELRNLRDPAVIAAFSGWNDAGEAATGVVLHLLECFPAEAVTALDSEDYYDFQEQRPQADEVDGKRAILWPSTEVFVAHAPARDLVLILGPEPNLRWRSFCAALVSMIRSVGPELVLTLGCMITDDPHTRPLPTYGSTSDEELMTSLGLDKETYSGPTGITGVLKQTCADAGLPAASLWGSSPHYSSSQDCPKAMLALLRRLGEVLDMEFPEADLVARSEEWERDLNSLIADDEDLTAYVAGLEAAQDEGLSSTTGDDIAAQFQKFLRRHDGHSGPGRAGA